MREARSAGLIFDIQRFSVHDGPGIRTAVFIKGCTLRCAWCCNPEGLTPARQHMYVAGNCVGCGRCRDACPRNAIVFADARRVDMGLCELCGLCAEACVFGALRMKGWRVTVPELLAELRKDSVQYRQSGGGVTLTGGEALTQPDFCAALLSACAAEGWDTAVETAANVPWENIARVLPHAARILLDIKHADSEKHRLFTKVPNELILANARRIAEYPGVNLVIRVPVIPGFNDTAEEISAIAEIAGGLPGVEVLHLLPFHRLGEGKYESLGCEYVMRGVEPLTAGRMEELRAVVCAGTSLRCKIGG